MNKLLAAIFGHPDLNKIGLFIRGFGLAVLASSIGALLYLLGQWANGEVIDWAIAKPIFVYNVVPTVTLWLTALKLWLEQSARVPMDEVNRRVEIGIKLPKGATPEDVEAIFQEEQKHEERIK